MIRFELIGTSNVLSALGRLENAVQEKALRLALIAGALPIQNEAKVLVPKITRTLARSIHIGGATGQSPGFNPSGDLAKYGRVYSDIGGLKVEANKGEVRIGTNLEYGPLVEYGIGRRTAKPYLRPAFDTKKDEAKGNIARVLKTELRKVAR